MSRRLASILFLAVATVLLGGAQSVRTVADQVDLRGYYADADAPIIVDDLERLAHDHPTIGFVALTGTPEGGADLLADQILTSVGARDTVIVITPDEFGGSSTVYRDAELAAAFERALDEPGDSYVEDLSQVATALVGSGGSPSTVGSSTGGGSWFLIVVLVGLGLLGFVLWRNSRRDREALAERTAEARAEIESQMAAVANEILEFSDRPDADAHPEAVSHFRTASEIFQRAEDRLSEASSPAALAELSDELAQATWELEAADALIEGRQVPEPPTSEAARCFFDPTHRAATEEATLTTPAGTRTVRVCRECAERLRRGDRPEPRTVEVGGHRIPAAQAPRSYGGGGFDWLGAFSILVGGMSDAVGYDWGRPRYPRRTRRSVRRAGRYPARRSRGTASRSRSVRRSVGRARRSR